MLRTKLHALVGLIVPLAVVLALGPAGRAGADEHDSPLSSAPKGRHYPKGENIAQSFDRPAAESAMMLSADAAPGRVNAAAAMSQLQAQPRTRDRARQQLVPVLRSQTRIVLSPTANGHPALTAEAAASAPALYKFTYGYQYKDVPLWRYSTQSQLIQAKGDSRKTLFHRERNAPRLEALGETEATVKAEDAGKVGLDDSKTDTRADLKVDAQGESPHREIHVNAKGDATLAWALVVRSSERARPFARRYWIAARGEPNVLSKEDLIYNAEADADVQSGRVTATVVGFKKSPLNPPAPNQGLNDYTAAIQGGTAVVTDANGNYTAGGPLNTRLMGPYCTIINDAGSPLTPSPRGKDLVFTATTEEELAQTSAFKWVSTAHAFVKDLLPTDAASLVALPTHVNIDDQCNAFFDPSEHTLNFFKSGGGCLNSAYSDVVFHEFGHAVDDQFGGILDGGYSEGFGDSIAILITRDSIIGRDFQGRGKPIRDARDVVTFPSDDPEVHQVGRIYGGFTWELTHQLRAKFTEDQAFAVAKQLILGAAALNPKDTTDAVRLSFLVDRQHGSPNFKELAAAADSRKIPRPNDPAEIDNPRFLAGNGGQGRNE